MIELNVSVLLFIQASQPTLNPPTAERASMSASEALQKSKQLLSRSLTSFLVVTPGGIKDLIRIVHSEHGTRHPLRCWLGFSFRPLMKVSF